MTLGQNLTLCLALDLTPNGHFQSQIKSKTKSKNLRFQTSQSHPRFFNRPLRLGSDRIVRLRQL